MKFKIFFILLLSFTLANCSKKDDGGGVGRDVSCVDGELKDVGIVGGKTVSAESWLARKIAFIVQLKEDKNSSLCTAVIVDANMILTAAHCVDEVKNSDYRQNLAVFFTTKPECDLNNKTITNSRVEVESVKIHEKWTGKPNDNNDLALIKLKDVVPQGYYPISLTSDFAVNNSETPILVSGYGKTNNYKEEDSQPILLRATFLKPVMGQRKENLKNDVKRKYKEILLKEGKSSEKAENTVNKEIDEIYSTIQVGPQFPVIYLDMTEGSGICAGDSGGPSMVKVNGEYQLTGIASFVVNRTDHEQCHSMGGYTSVTFYKDWINTTFKKLKNAKSTKEKLL